MALKTEYSFNLPRGFVDDKGTLHKEGIMRLATAADEILTLKDPRVQQNPAYKTIILLSRVITKLGTLEDVNSRIIEGLFVSDLEYLQEFYNNINDEGKTSIEVTCPYCGKQFEAEISIRARGSLSDGR